MRWLKLEPIIQSVRKKNTNKVYEHIYMRLRKMVTMTLCVRQQKRHRCKQQSFELCEEDEGGMI